jgi:hypothetical protein
MKWLEVWATEIGNAYLEPIPQEKMYIIGGSDFGKLEGSILIIQKALYDLWSLVIDPLETAGMDVWLTVSGIQDSNHARIRPSKDKSCCEMVAVCVDDLAFGGKDPQGLLDTLIQK